VTEGGQPRGRRFERRAILAVQRFREARVEAERDPQPAGIAALSRTVRVTTCSPMSPNQMSASSGPVGLRPRLGLSPTSPQFEAGVRIDPPPSLAFAAGTMRAATAAADPPLEPLEVRSRFQGLRVGPKSSGSVTFVRPSSGVLVLPNITRPALR
jgi:hypothetical protein